MQAIQFGMAKQPYYNGEPCNLDDLWVDRCQKRLEKGGFNELDELRQFGVNSHIAHFDSVDLAHMNVAANAQFSQFVNRDEPNPFFQLPEEKQDIVLASLKGKVAMERVDLPED